MTRRQLDEEAIFEVAREIGKPETRAKYLDQVGADKELRSRLEQRLKTRRRWQFGLRSLFVAMLLAATLSAGLAISFRQAMRAREMERLARRRAAEAMLMAEKALAEAEKAALETGTGNDRHAELRRD